MTVENGKIVKITENELFDLYLNRGMDDVMSFPDYKERFEKAIDDLGLTEEDKFILA